jgi:hypothetical protein
MAAYLSTEQGGTANQTVVPVGYKPRASVYQARLKRLRATFTFATQTVSDTLVVGTLPAGATFALGATYVSVSTGSATIAVGTTGATGKYKAAGAVTSVDIPNHFGVTAAVAAADPALTAEEIVFVTIAGASLPASGTMVIDIYYSMPQ